MRKPAASACAALWHTKQPACPTESRCSPNHLLQAPPPGEICEQTRLKKPPKKRVQQECVGKSESETKTSQHAMRQAHSGGQRLLSRSRNKPHLIDIFLQTDRLRVATCAARRTDQLQRPDRCAPAVHDLVMAEPSAQPQSTSGPSSPQPCTMLSCSTGDAVNNSSSSLQVRRVRQPILAARHNRSAHMGSDTLQT